MSLGSTLSNFLICKIKQWIERIGKRERQSVRDRREMVIFVIVGNKKLVKIKCGRGLVYCKLL